MALMIIKNVLLVVTNPQNWHLKDLSFFLHIVWILIDHNF